MIKLSSNPTCTLTDADCLTAEQRQRLNMNLTKGIPGSDIEGDKVTVINSEGEVEMKAYSAGGGGGSSYTAGDGIRIADDVISTKIDGTSITLNARGELQTAGGSGPTLHILEYGTSPKISADTAQAWINAGDIIVAKYDNNFFNLAMYKIYRANNRDQKSNLRAADTEWLVYFSFTGITGYNPFGGSYFGIAHEIRYQCTKDEGIDPERDEWYLQSINLHQVLPEWDPNLDDGKVLKIIDNAPTWVTP